MPKQKPTPQPTPPPTETYTAEQRAALGRVVAILRKVDERVKREEAAKSAK